MLPADKGGMHLVGRKAELQAVDYRDTDPPPLGAQIRDLRKAKSISTAALAEAIGKSAGYINNIEHERTEISVTGLKRISDALDVHISWFFQALNVPNSEEAGFVVRHDNRRQLRLAGAGINEELLSPLLTSDIQMVLSTFAPGAITGNEPTQTDAEMAGIVLSGQLDISIDDKQFHLEQGDSFLVPKGARRQCENKSGNDSVTLWVNTPPVY
jgi:transcriptional regulator with XRE-family HTH domain